VHFPVGWAQRERAALLAQQVSLAPPFLAPLCHRATPEQRPLEQKQPVVEPVVLASGHPGASPVHRQPEQAVRGIPVVVVLEFPVTEHLEANPGRQPVPAGPGFLVIEHLEATLGHHRQGRMAALMPVAVFPPLP
jgi:hypothetical protein